MSNIIDLQKLPYFRSLNFDTVFDKQVSIAHNYYRYLCVRSQYIDFYRLQLTISTTHGQGGAGDVPNLNNTNVSLVQKYVTKLFNSLFRQA